jgi:glycine cleavage system H lipoate-binding protein
MAEGYYYHMGHTWARFEHGGRVRMGFDEFLVKLFGAMKALTLPPPGANLKQHEVGFVFRRNGLEAAVLSPVTGTVLATNHKVLGHPDTACMDPYQEGWLILVEPRFPKGNLKGLYFGSESYEWMEMENRKLISFLGPEYEKLAATGVEVIHDIYGSMIGNSVDLGWDLLVKTFLRTEGV